MQDTGEADREIREAEEDMSEELAALFDEMTGEDARGWTSPGAGRSGIADMESSLRLIPLPLAAQAAPQDHWCNSQLERPLLQCLETRTHHRIHPRHMDRLGFVTSSDDTEPFGFLDPANVVHACHLIPALAHGRMHELLPPLIAREANETDED
ncbi:hypothetical protein JB92DRAFT_3127902 [Gautieria morchelliformis]|nr:hypothetical protein JB92DRAFT_3127902 [Gautieria morchelliformis]